MSLEDRRKAAISKIDAEIQSHEIKIMNLKRQKEYMLCFDNFEVDDNNGARITSGHKSSPSVVNPKNITVDRIIDVLQRNKTPEKCGLVVRFHSDFVLQFAEKELGVFNTFWDSYRWDSEEFVFNAYFDEPSFEIVYSHIHTGATIKKINVNIRLFRIFLTNILTSDAAKVYDCYNNEWDGESGESDESEESNEC